MFAEDLMKVTTDFQQPAEDDEMGARRRWLPAGIGGTVAVVAAASRSWMRGRWMRRFGRRPQLLVVVKMVLFALVLACVLSYSQNLQAYIRSKLWSRLQSDSGIHDVSGTPQARLPHLNPDAQVLIAVVSAPPMLRTLGLAARATWVMDLSDIADVIFFVGACTVDVEAFPGNIVCLDMEDDYPPQKKVFRMFQYMYRHFRPYRWYMKADNDAFVNARQLRAVLALPMAADASYIGQPARGRAAEQKALGLEGRTYCLGLGYLLSVHALTIVAENADLCLENVCSNHSDTEVARCMQATDPKLECQRPEPYRMKQIYYSHTDDQEIVPLGLTGSGQMHLVFPRAPKAPYFEAVVLHPLKQSENFYQFHTQLRKRLRPPQPPARNGPQLLVRQARADILASCVHNPVFQRNQHGFLLPECPLEMLRENTQGDISSQQVLARMTAFLSSPLRQTEAHQSDTEVTPLAANLEFLKRKGIETVVVDDWRTGLAELEELPAFVLVLDKGARIRADAWHALQRVLEDVRCGLHMVTHDAGGAIVLTTSPPREPELLADAGDSLCYNVPMRHLSAAGLLLHRSALESVQGDLYKHAIIAAKHPIPLLADMLSLRGHVVRAGVAPLLIMQP